MSKYTIPYKGLKNGKHSFEFVIDDAFFKAFDDAEFDGGDCIAKVVMDKSASMLSLDVTIEGNVDTKCDRCLDEISLPIHYQDTLTVKFSETEDDTDGDVMWISPAETEVELGQYLYESIILSLPYQRVHDNLEECNQEMLEKFKIVTQEEFDTLTTPCETLSQTPEGEKLKELKNELENRN